MTEPYIGEVQIFGFSFAPRGWSFADGSLLPIRQSGSLFALYGTQFGGDGASTFGLPNLVSREACSAGQSPGNSRRSIGQTFGTTSVALQTSEMPPHNHMLSDYQPSNADQLVSVPAMNEALGYFYNQSVEGFAAPNGAAIMDPNALGQAGSGAPHPNQQPYLGLTYAVALFGSYPYFN